MTVSTSELPLDAAINPNVDYEVLRAQLVNCVNIAATIFTQLNAGLSATCVFTRFMGLGLLFNLQSTQFDTRRYILKLTNPDGTRANFVRLDNEGAEVALDEVDTAYMNALAHCMEETVHAAWKQMVPKEHVITHMSTTILH